MADGRELKELMSYACQTGVVARTAALMLVALLFAAPSAANDPPRCSASTLGATACLDGVLCECINKRGGSITGKASGPQWRCDAVRPRCGDATAAGDGGVPATLPYTPFPYPYSLGIDRSRNNTIIQQDQTANPSGGNVTINK